SCYHEIINLKNCTKLASLYLSNLKSTKEIKLDAPNLEVLSLINCSKLEKLPGLSNYIFLKKVIIRLCPKFYSLGRMPVELDTLVLSYCSFLENIDELKYCTKLRVLELNNSQKIKSIKCLA